jgi:uncharacterized protein YsxB (DUF464 family)
VRIETERGILRRLEVTGHDKQKGRGASLVCAVVTAFARTAGRVIEREKGIRWRGEAPGPGKLYLEIDTPPEEKTEWLKGYTRFLITGINDLKREFPSKLEVQYTGEQDGT